MRTTEEKMLSDLDAIRRKWKLTFIPVCLAFVAAVVIAILGSSPDTTFLIVLPGFLLTTAIGVYQISRTKCPKCGNKFYSFLFFFGIGAHSKRSCNSCDFSAPDKPLKKSYLESTGDEWDR